MEDRLAHSFGEWSLEGMEDRIAHSFGEWSLEGMEDRIAHSFGEWSLETGVGNPECLSRLLGWIRMRSIPVFGVLGASIGARGFSSEPEFSEVIG